MKKLAFLTAGILVSLTLNAQQALRFKIKFLPDHSYNAIMKMAMNMEMTGMPTKKAGSKKTVSKKPVLTEIDMTIKLDVTTGSVIPNNSFPVTMRYKDMTTKSIVNNKVTPAIKNPLIGQVVYGQSDMDGKFQIDSVSGAGTNEQMKTVMKNMVNTIQGNIQFPEKELSIGESFTQEVPMNMPAAGMNMDMKAKMTYTLKSIKANLAYFDTNIAMTFGLDSEKNGGMKMTGNGGGKGILIYNIAENYFTSMTNTMSLNYNMTMGDKMKMDAKMKIVSEIQNVISRN